MTVFAQAPEDIALACESATETVGFLSTLGMDASGPVEVRVVGRLPSVCMAESFGCYENDSQRIHILNLSECLRRHGSAAQLVDAALWQSLLAHEITHAVADVNFSMRDPSILAQEYIAYVAMFAVMLPARRKQLLSEITGAGFTSPDQMSLTFYLMNPLRFGVESYRHFLAAGNGPAFIHKVLAGKVLNRQ